MVRWRIFRQSIISNYLNVILYSLAAIALHNYLLSTESVTYCPAGFVDGEDGDGNIIDGAWRSESDTPSSMESTALTGSNMLVMFIGI